MYLSVILLTIKISQWVLNDWMIFCFKKVPVRFYLSVLQTFTTHTLLFDLINDENATTNMTSIEQQF